MIEQIEKCQKCGLCCNQKPLLERKRECQVFWVGLSAKMIKTENEEIKNIDCYVGITLE